MASTYSPNLRLELIGTGEQQGTWGSTTNTNLGTLLEEAIGGYVSVTVSDVADTTLTTSNGSADQSRNMVINLTGALTGTRNVICPAIEKLYVVKNATTGGQSIVFKVSGQTGITVPNGAIELLYVDGTDARSITGTIASQDANNVSITGGSISNVSLSNASVVANASSLSVRDADGSNIMSIAVGSNLTANRVFTLTAGDAARTLDISASNVTISTAGAALIDDADASAQRTTLGLGTGDSPEFLAVNVGNATDTTITRVSAGVVAVEGKNVALNGTTETLTTGSIELGAATDTTLSRSAAGVLAVEGNLVPSPGSQAQGDILYRGSTNWERLAAGTSGLFLKTQGAGANPIWDTPAGGLVYISSGVVSAGGTTNFTSIPQYTTILLQISGAYSGSSGLGTALQVAFSSNNGTSYGSVRQLCSADINGQFVFQGWVTLSNTKNDGASKVVTPAVQRYRINTNPASVTNYTTTATETSVTGIINALQFTTSTSGALATVTLFGIS